MSKTIPTEVIESKKSLKTTIKSFIFFIIKIAIAAGIIFWLISNHYNDFVKVLKNVDFSWLIAAAILYFIIMLGSALRWFLLLKLIKIEITFFETLSLTMQGMFFSLVLPGGSIGGDLVKTGFLVSRTPKGRKLAATSTIFMDRFLGMFGQFSIGIVMAVICMPLIMRMDELTRITMLLIVLICIVGIIVGVIILLHRKLEKIRLFAWCIKFADRLTKGLISKLTEILDVYKGSKKTMIKCILIGVVAIQLNMAFILYFIARGIHASYIALKPCILGISLGNTAGLLPITPSGIGTRDAVVKAVLATGGFFQGDAVAIPLLFSAIIILFSLLGGVFFVFTKNKKNTAKAVNSDARR